MSERPLGAGFLPERYTDLIKIHQSRDMGSLVLRADDLVSEQQVAVKIKNPEVSDNARNAVEHEADVLDKLRHCRHVVDIVDADPDAHMPYLTTKLLPNATNVGERFRYYADPVSAVEYTISVLTAVDALHAKGFLHGDLKPSNTLQDDEGKVVLVDLECSTSLKSKPDKLVKDKVIGTPRYMPPEITRGERGDQSSDVYSASLMLVEFLTGEPAIQGETDEQTFMNAHHGMVKMHGLKDLKETRPFVGVAEQGTERDPLRRFRTAKSMANALKIALAESQREQEGISPVPRFRILRANPGVA